jgi:hypothetical protein
MSTFELHREALGTHSLQVQTWLREAAEALNRGDGAVGEHWIRKALEVEPDAPDILNNLALARQMQGHEQEGEDLIHEIHQRHPDYLFGGCGVARFLIRDGKLAEAKALLEPLLKRRRLHFSEFAALCGAQIELLLAECQKEGARSWLQVWEQYDPGHPDQEQCRRLVEKPGWLRRLTGWGR